MKDSRARLPRAAALLVLALALRAAFFSISVTHVQPTADESIGRLQADLVAAGDFQALFMAQPYLFPVESYLAAPLSPFLPHDAFGARLVPFLLNLAAVIVALVILGRAGGLRANWGGALLILFPPAYMLMMQSAAALPGYAALPLLGGLAVLTALLQRESSRHAFTLAAVAGLLSGLSFSSNMISLPFVAMTSAYVCLGKDRRSSLNNSLAFVPAAVVGLLPYLLTKWRMPGAYAAVTQHYEPARALERIWSPAIKWTMTTVLGVRMALFPDGDAITFTALSPAIFGALFGALLLGLAFLQAGKFLLRAAGNRWPSLETQDMFVGIAVLTLAVFVFGRRAGSSSYRYLVPLAWSFPFLIAGLQRCSFRPLRVIVGGLALCWAGWNIVAAVMLAGHWRQPEFPVAHAGVADLGPALRHLEERGIRHAVASYGTAYRATFMADGKVLAGQPFNERFPGWPVPYKEEVDGAAEVAYVLTDTVRFLKPEIFERHLRTMGVESRKTIRGDYSIYTDFEERDPRPWERVVGPGRIAFTASHNSGATSRLSDGVLDNRWTTARLQEEGMWLRGDFETPVRTSRIRLHYGRYFHDHAREMNLRFTTASGEEFSVGGVAGALDKFRFRNGHPVYTGSLQTLNFPALTASAFEMRIVRADPRFSWTIGEVEVLEDPRRGDR